MSSWRRAASPPEVPTPWSAPQHARGLPESSGACWPPEKQGTSDQPRARACWPRTAQSPRPDPASRGRVSTQPRSLCLGATGAPDQDGGSWTLSISPTAWAPAWSQSRRHSGESRTGKAREGPATGLTPPSGSGPYSTGELGSRGCGCPIPGQWLSWTKDTDLRCWSQELQGPRG